MKKMLSLYYEFTLKAELLAKIGNPQNIIIKLNRPTSPIRSLAPSKNPHTAETRV